MHTQWHYSFDTDETLHLSLPAIDRTQADNAIQYRKRIPAIEPKHGTALSSDYERDQEDSDPS
jgi:hypothetical protein